MTFGQGDKLGQEFAFEFVVAGFFVHEVQTAAAAGSLWLKQKKVCPVVVPEPEYVRLRRIEIGFPGFFEKFKNLQIVGNEFHLQVQDKFKGGNFYLAAMKNTFIIAALLTTFCAGAQSFNSPESVEYDVAGGRWIVGQNGSGNVHILSPASNTLNSFATGIPSGPHGIEVAGDTVFVCDGARVKGFDRNTGTQVINVNLGATFLNGITSDGGDNLFITDFTAKKIYRFNRRTLANNVMVTGLVKSPNGIYYDAANNRCVFVNWGSNATIMAMSLSDSSTSTLTTTTLTNIDGITRDFSGNWYVTAWGNQSLMRFDPAFANAPVAVMTGLSNPADIDINAVGDSIGIPNSGTANNVVFYTVSVTTSAALPDAGVHLTVFPNPATDMVRLKWTTDKAERLIVYTQTGSEAGSSSGKIYPLNGICELEIELSAWTKGAYILVFVNAAGGQLATQTLLVQ